MAIRENRARARGELAIFKNWFGIVSVMNILDLAWGSLNTHWMPFRFRVSLRGINSGFGQKILKSSFRMIPSNGSKRSSAVTESRWRGSIQGHTLRFNQTKPSRWDPLGISSPVLGRSR
ncbi:predicted protein [Uncinocarpus reesii 1704]|uniref:Uncharacterized protein n=1 Tax=Uncinocarpus reesii (strain UAMH 1704) TaxID=336963 RepID=C4JPG7_UNCRE|nr:uncharacterized protein UREG_03138 [Uncinocarpus reesii 1704]EEP78293.1 predicted protein [Uncinocarpus reesii 1704]